MGKEKERENALVLAAKLVANKINCNQGGNSKIVVLCVSISVSVSGWLLS